MARIFGENLSRQEILKRMGRVSQVAGMRRYRLEEGRADGMNAVEVRTGGGLDFTVYPSRAMDIGQATFRGVPLAWISQVGPSSPVYYDPVGANWGRNFAGGLLTSCGMRQSGAACEDAGEHLGAHGRISNTPAQDLSMQSTWEGDEYVMKLSGSAYESCAGGEHLCMHRTITTRLGENQILLEDRFENLGFAPSPFLFIYHINLGFPLLDAGSQVYITAAETTPNTAFAKSGVADRLTICDPIPGVEEQVYWNTCYPDEENMGHAMLYNPRLELGLLISFDLTEMPNLTEWKMMGEGSYVLGLEPCNCRTLGRAVERERGALREILPGEVKTTKVVFTVLDGAASAKDAMQKFNR